MPRGQYRGEGVNLNSVTIHESAHKASPPTATRHTPRSPPRWPHHGPRPPPPPRSPRQPRAPTAAAVAAPTTRRGRRSRVRRSPPTTTTTKTPPPPPPPTTMTRRRRRRPRSHRSRLPPGARGEASTTPHLPTATAARICRRACMAKPRATDRNSGGVWLKGHRRRLRRWRSEEPVVAATATAGRSSL